MQSTIHIRGLHYSIVARGSVLRPDGQIYVNDEANWTWLQQTAVPGARWNGFVPFSSITDERNAPPVIHRKARVPRVTSIDAGLEFDVSVPSLDDLMPTVSCCAASMPGSHIRW